MDERFDAVGVLGLLVGLGSGVFALLAGPDSGWGSPWVVGGAVLAVLLLVSFVRHDRRMSHPLLDPALFATSRYRQVATVAFVANAQFSAVAFFASLYLQQVAGLSAALAGAVFLAMTAPLIALSPRVGRIEARIGTARALVFGLVALALAAGLLASLDAGGGLTPVIVVLALTGTGQAIVFTLTNVVAVDAQPGAAGLESGMINEVRQLGALIGLAFLGAMFANGQARMDGPSAVVFVDALRWPSLLLAIACLGTVAAARRLRAPVDD